MNLLPYYNYKMKKISTIISIAIVLLMIIFKYIGSYDKIFDFLKLLLAIFLFFIPFCKEKNDDERILKIIGNSFRIAFGAIFSFLLALDVTSNILNSNLTIEYSSIVIFGTLIYIVIFNLSFYLDNYYLSENTLFENIIENKKFYTIYSILMVIIVTTLFIL